MPKELVVMECRKCGGSYYGGTAKLVLNPGTKDNLPDEICFIIKRIARCTFCQQQGDRSRGGRNRKFRMDSH